MFLRLLENYRLNSRSRQAPITPILLYMCGVQIFVSMARHAVWDAVLFVCLFVEGVSHKGSHTSLEL